MLGVEAQHEALVARALEVVAQYVLHLRCQMTDVVAIVLLEIAELVRRRNNRLDAVVSSHPRHRKRIAPVARTIVDAGQKVAMNINKWFWWRKHFAKL